MSNVNFQLHCDNFGRLVLTDAEGVRHEGVTPVRAFTDSAIASHLNLRRLASVMSGKMSGFIAILCTATEPTPPAPITRTLLTPNLLCGHRGRI